MPSEGYPQLRKFRAIVAIFGLAVALGCGSGSSTQDAGDDRSRAIAAARELAKPTTPLPARPEVLVSAQTLEAFAVKEGAGATARELHELAATLFERAYRRDGKEQDGKEALASFTAAAKDLKLGGACEAGLHGARLAGDVAHDAETTYTELYRLDRRLDAGLGVDGGAPSTCALDVKAELVELAAFRPAPRVLAAVDTALAAEGLLAGTADGGRPTEAAKVVRVEQWPGKDAARVVVTLNHAASYRAGDEASSGGKGARTFIELDGVDLGTAGRSTDTVGVIRRVSVEPTVSGTRIAMDIDGGQAYRHVFTLLEPYRIVIDVARHPPGLGGATASRRSVQRIVLDPGHGGNDAGAIGPTGVKEKDVTLDVVKRAAKALAAVGLTAYVTRDDDRYVTLEERTARANQLGADLFVSVHCNAAENHARRGVETYVLDTTKDDIAARVASRENATTEQATAELGSILASMRLADQASHSTRLAELLQKSAMASLKPTFSDTIDGGVHPAGFYVLVGARMPAVLFETSYVSNAVEELRLASDDYKNLLVDAIVNAIRAYREGR